MLRPEEKLVFEAFLGAHPNFAGRPVTTREGADPPDYLCVDTAGKRIGVELGEWLNERQMRTSIRRERLEDSYLKAIRSKEVPPPSNVGLAWLGPEPDKVLPSQDAVEFRGEVLKFLGEMDAAWPNRTEWHGPQGAHITDFSRYPILGKYLNDLHSFSRNQFNTWLGYEWICFPSRGGAYTPADAVDALLELIKNKLGKYTGLLQKENLDELYLIVYYNKGLLHNTPFVAPGFGFRQVAEIAAQAVAQSPGPFTKIFLFNALKPDLEVLQVWPPEK